MRALSIPILFTGLVTIALGFAAAQQPLARATPELFRTADACMACHNGLSTTAGEDVSIGFAWRASMMANSARDPYWHAAVRREIIDYPDAVAAIEDECSRCHMPMANVEARASGGAGSIFEHLPVGSVAGRTAELAADGVSCTVCHQIEPGNFGQRESFTGNFLIDESHPWERRRIYGPFDVDSGRITLMRSASAFRPTQSSHVQQSELCATCHMLYTHALSPGSGGATLPEQTPYLEWAASDFRYEQSCQSCHMPVVQTGTLMASVLGLPRDGVSRHAFTGGNFFMLRMLNRYRDELGVTALPQELETAALRTEAQLQSGTATIAIERVSTVRDRIDAVVHITNLAGHKLPTAYPSRRAWIEFTVRDGSGRAVFASGALRADGSIDGNDNDEDPRRYEPHYERITAAEQVQVYESIMAAPDGSATTGLLTGVSYLKDNRLLPIGYDRSTASPDIAVHGAAADDADFTGGSDRITYSVDVASATGPFTIEASLWFQPIGFRWAENLKSYDAPETNRFVRYYESMSDASAIVLARAVMRLVE